MDNGNEISSSLSFASSFYLSNRSESHLTEAATDPQVSNLETLSLNKLSSSLEKLLLDEEYDYSDAEIVVEGNVFPPS
ncbi:NPR1/NIM1-like regulatory protein [Corchorus olitorius]|uniref:NPR1/NIM1-like regulatory protein n=1 Tax=Corchorus olitorius TaxID=93759 RepID=A0A1R3KKI0_9ROSI|nr:NPR1/NIM1-like regulatory protein [Corchorus olitorius]